jgi:predicted transcriptional regulator YdeE
MKLDLEDFELIGIAVRTSNEHDQSESDIRALWQRFIADDIQTKIPEKISKDIYCVYTDYASDHLGAYTTILGCQVKPGTIPPSGFVRKIVLKSTYEVFISQGPMPGSIQDTWTNIRNSGLKRRYTADFDVYGPHAKNPEKSIVRTFVSVEQ